MNPYEAPRSSELGPPRRPSFGLRSIFLGPLPGGQAGCLAGIFGLLVYLALFLYGTVVNRTPYDSEALLGGVIWVVFCGFCGLVFGTTVAAVRAVVRWLRPRIVEASGDDKRS